MVPNMKHILMIASAHIDSVVELIHFICHLPHHIILFLRQHKSKCHSIILHEYCYYYVIYLIKERHQTIHTAKSLCNVKSDRRGQILFCKPG